MELEDFLANQTSRGEQVTEDSVFTLNPIKVRERVATFCSAEELYPFYRCLQGILRVTESDLVLNQKDGAWQVTFSWRGMPYAKHFKDFLTDGLSEPFDQVPAAATQHFFFGLSGALGIPNYRIELRSPQGTLTIKNGKLELDEAQDNNTCELRFSIDSSWWSKITGSNSLGASSTAKLRRRLCFSAVPIHIDGELLAPAIPEIPEQPWSTRFSAPSNLAWRYIPAQGGGLLNPPEFPLDRYRAGSSGKKGQTLHLMQDEAKQPLPLSIQYAPPAKALSTDSNLTNPHITTLADSRRLYRAAIFLSLGAGRQDWLLCVRDGLLCDPMPVNIAKAGFIVLAADSDLLFDLSGLKVVANAKFEEKLIFWAAEAKALRSQLKVSLANIGLRAESMPSQYYQASGYVIGGPYAGLLGGKLTPWLNKLSRSRQKL